MRGTVHCPVSARRRDVLRQLSGCALMATTPGLALAQQPRSEADADAPVKLLVPALQSSSADMIGRLVAVKLGRVLDAPVEVRNIPGESSIIGTRALAIAPKDGKTLAIGLSQPMTGGKLLSPQADYNPVDDFDWLAILGTYGDAMMVRPQSPALSLAQWLEFARKAAAPLRYGTSGIASAAHLAGEYLHVVQQANLVHVPFDDNSLGYAALERGEIDVLFYGAPAARIVAKATHLRILAVTSAERDPQLPEVPSFAEVWRNQHFDNWAAIIAPSQLPPDLRSPLAAAIGVMLADKTLVSDLRDMGVNWLGLAGDSASQYVRDDIVRKARQIGDLAIRPVAGVPRGDGPRN